MRTKEVSKSEYSSIHHWIRKNYGSPCKCDICKATDKVRYEWALRIDCVYAKNIKNFMRLCKGCHIKYDMTDDWRGKMRTNRKGKKHSEEVKRKMRESQKFVDHSWRIGRPVSQAQKESIRKTLTGLKREFKPKTDIHKYRLSKSTRANVDLEDAFRMRQNGALLAEIGRKYNVSENVIGVHLRKYKNELKNKPTST